MADGGVVTKPTFALIGEAGPEAVVPLRGTAAIGSTTVIVNVDVHGFMGPGAEQELARVIQSQLALDARRQGASVIGGFAT